ncbi:uncharacterized protein SAPINGB_P001842 [Magnusiomyces paraingens]|uniref:aromatic-amino-acid transaminase n=1 Tax=Magnusiomyces paraingens TaxID=2606893 RepID=A0A5E8BCY1_9ASCO|nr:uncharacterized protein SAPINGB_P001842 [Saprochaete ingens]VVT48567.1 unnamed protein product [Saprochaete ingens]
MTGPILAKDLSHHLSEEAKSRQASTLKLAFKHFSDPRIVSLGGGLPLPDLFPFNSLKVETLNPPFSRGIDVFPESSDEALEVVVAKSRAQIEHDHDIPLETALQYGSSAGNTQIVEFLREHTRIIHSPKYQDWDIVMSVGNTQAWDSTLRTFTTRGDVIFAEQFTFSSAAETVHANGVKIFPVPTDLEGIDAEAFAEILANWEGPIPKLLYTIPTGQNPTGGTMPAERRKKVYDLACKYDFIIVEDEPYYFLQMHEYKFGATAADLPPVPSHDEFLKSLVPSYLSLDTEGRVLRLDSFSKVLAPGSRLGWIVGQERLIERFLRQHEVTIQVASGFSQAILNGMLHRWGQEGYLDWLIQLRRNYTLKRNVALDAVKKYVPSEVADWIAPSAGMFFWIQLDASKHPDYEKLGRDPAAVEMQIYERGIEDGVLMIPGHWFVIEDERAAKPPSREGRQFMYFRGTFASVKPEALDKGLNIFGDLIKKEYQL